MVSKPSRSGEPLWRAEANGQFRVVANHRRVSENLERVIAALDVIAEEGPYP